jgi:CDP-glycerol glycerophosphotransferase
MIKYILKLVSGNRKRVVIFGASKAGQIAFSHLKNKYNVVAFCDNNKTLHGQKVLKRIIVAPSELDSLVWDRIIIASMFHKEIHWQLTNDLGVDPCKVDLFNPLDDYSSYWGRLINAVNPFFIQFLKRLKEKQFSASSLAAKIYNDGVVDVNSIVYESYNGRLFSCNPKYLLDYFLDNRDKYNNFTHVIAVLDVDHPSVKKYHDNPSVRIVELDSLEYVKLAQGAKYHINNCTIRPYLIKSPDQVWITTWHGSLLKKLGNDTGRYWEGRNIVRTILNTDFFISPNEFTTEKFFSAYGATNLFSGHVLHTGYPRCDATINTHPRVIREMLGVPEGKKIVLYGPTWRGDGVPKNTIPESNIIRNFLQSIFPTEYVVLIKYHSMVYPFLSPEDLRNCVPLEVDTSELLSAVDLLISDFSGLIFDYLVTGNPFILFASDFDEYYASKNGLYILPDEFPVHFCKNIEELESAVRAYCSGDYCIPNYKSFSDRFVHLEDGMSSKRAVEFIFDGVEPKKGSVSIFSQSKMAILINVGDLGDNGVTTSLLSLCNYLDHDKYNVVYFLNSYAYSQHKQVLLNPKGTFIYNDANSGYLYQEFRDLEIFLSKGKFKENSSLHKFVIREKQRLFGETYFHRVINFHGYSGKDALLLGLIQGDNLFRSIFLHNDLHQDYITKNRNLLSVFAAYKFYDKLVNVSSGVMESNSSKLGLFVRQNFGLSISGKISFSLNLINYEYIDSKISDFDFDVISNEILLRNKMGVFNEVEKIVRVKKPSSSKISFVVIGRLSKEKGHFRLLQAFKALAEHYCNVELYIVGDGFLKGEIEQKVIELNLSDFTIMTGYLDNPYPILQSCDCLILPSDYEGLGMVILEAFYLRKPVIVSDVPGCRELVQQYYGVLVERSVESLTQAMLDFCLGFSSQNTSSFDADQYNKNSYKLFLDAVGLES